MVNSTSQVQLLTPDLSTWENEARSGEPRPIIGYVKKTNNLPPPKKTRTKMKSRKGNEIYTHIDMS